jgi:hypothetical protein
MSFNRSPASSSCLQRTLPTEMSLDTAVKLLGLAVHPAQRVLGGVFEAGFRSAHGGPPAELVTLRVNLSRLEPAILKHQAVPPPHISLGWPVAPPRSRSTHSGQGGWIGGYTQPGGERRYIGALLVGVYKNGKFKFAGREFSEKLLKSLWVEPSKIAVKACPFYNRPVVGRGLDPGLSAAEMKRRIWIKPSKVCVVKFTEWTRDDRLRQPVFLGLRKHKNASEIVREKTT